MPHQVSTSFQAVQNLKEMMNPKTERLGLNKTALRWQLAKNKVDGYFLSCGTSKKEAYDGYPFVFRFDLQGVTYTPWYQLGSTTFDRTAVEKCYLFTNTMGLEGASTIVLFCLEGGFARKKEVLIMSPVAMDDRCTILCKKTGKYISLEQWKRDNDPDACRCPGCSKR